MSIKASAETGDEPPTPLRDDRGATATEYAILVALIAIAIVGGITLFGTQLNQWFSTLAAGVP